MNVRGIDLEILEEVDSHEPSPAGIDFVLPNKVRINGMDVYGPKGSKVTLTMAPGEEWVLATMTLACRSVRVAADTLDEDDDTDPPIFEQLEEELGRVPALAALIFAARQELGQQIRGHAGYTIRDIERIKQQIAEGRSW